MKKIFLFFITSLFILLFSCASVEKAETVETNSPAITTVKIDELKITDSDDYFKYIPNLYINYNGELYSALRGTCSWYVDIDGKSHGLAADTAAPEVLIQRHEKTIIIDEEAYIELVFDRDTISYEVKIWNSDDYDLSQIITTENDSIHISKKQPFTIYQVGAKFEFTEGNVREHGYVYYVFAIN